MENKKGTHVGIVLSLVLFVAFLVFIYAILGPAIEVQKNRQLAIDHLELSIVERSTSNFTIVAFSMSDTYDYNGENYPGFCIDIDHLIDYKDLNHTVKDENDVIINSYSSDTLLELPWDTPIDFFRVYYTNESLVEHNMDNRHNCQVLTLDTHYFIESVNSDEKIHDMKIKALINEYNQHYEDLKEGFDIPFETEFGFNFTYNNGTSIGPTMDTAAPEIYVQDFTIEYVDTEAHINPGTLSIITW